jgi:hypothetical protein
VAKPQLLTVATPQLLHLIGTAALAGCQRVEAVVAKQSRAEAPKTGTGRTQTTSGVGCCVFTTEIPDRDLKERAQLYPFFPRRSEQLPVWVAATGTAVANSGGYRAVRRCWVVYVNFVLFELNQQFLCPV